MSRDILQRLYDQKAFKPAPALWEAAQTHVDLGSLGVEQAAEPRLLSGLRSTEGLVMLLGDSGAGKSSTLAFAANELTREGNGDGLPFLPVFVPVAGRGIEGDLDAFGAAACREVLLSLRDALPPHYRNRLSKQIAASVSAQHPGAKFNARIVAKIFGAGPEVGMELGSQILTITEKRGLDNHGGIRTLGDICRTQGFEPVLLVEDTDAWARTDEGTTNASRFFGTIVRPLAAEPDVPIAIAVQRRWRDDGSSAVVDALQRAVSVVDVPRATSPAAATQIIIAVLGRRIAYSLDGTPDLGDDPARALFSEEALATLGHEFSRSGSLRKPLAHVRDALDRHADAMPDQVSEQHLLDAL